MGDDDVVKPGTSLVDQARAKINKKAKDAVVSKLEANCAKMREHEVSKVQATRACDLAHEKADEAVKLLTEENGKIVEEYEAGLI